MVIFGLTLQCNCPPRKVFTTGLCFKGKSSVFIVDVSGSMVCNEDLISPVKAGLHILNSPKDESYTVNEIRLPFQFESDYKSIFELLQHMTEAN